MDFPQTVVLGAFAGFTIYLGLPLGRVKRVSPQIRTFMSMISAGIIFFLLFSMLSKLSEPIEATFEAATKGQAPLSDFLLLFSIFIAGFGIGLLGLFGLEREFLRSNVSPATQIPPSRVALLIAIGLGLHNFSEGLAIGQSAGRGEVSFATLLIVGFALHNATEGFCIVGPLSGIKTPWGFLGILGLIGGGPTMIGTWIGYRFTSTPTSIFFLALASGALIYLLGELFILGRREAFKFYMGWGLFVGFLVAFFTDLLLVASHL